MTKEGKKCEMNEEKKKRIVKKAVKGSIYDIFQ
jgi:hypothetical protein